MNTLSQSDHDKIIGSFLNDQTISSLNPIRKSDIIDFPSWHFPMMKDEKRLSFYRSFLQKEAKDKIVLDMGAGCGLLSALAFEAGAKKVYAIERHPALIAILKSLFKEQVRSGKMVIIPMDTKLLSERDFQDHPEILVHEIFSSDGLGEGIFRAMTDLSKLTFYSKLSVFPSHIKIKAELINLASMVDLPMPKIAGIDFSTLDPLEGVMPSNLSIPDGIGNWLTTSDTELVWKGRFLDTFKPEIFQCSFNPLAESSHIRLWFELKNDAGDITFTSDLKDGFHHWGNEIYRLPSQINKNEIHTSWEVDGNCLRLIEIS